MRIFFAASLVLSAAAQQCSGSVGTAANSTLNSTSSESQIAKIETATQAWIYGLPAYSFAQTRNFFTDRGIPLNFIQYTRLLSNAANRVIVRPNSDTLYSIAFFDLSQGPITVHLPNVQDRFFVAAMYDAYTNNFANPGTASNSSAGNYVIYGPNDAACATKSEFTIISPTNDVWFLARMYILNATEGSQDYVIANSIQDQIRVVDSPTPILIHDPTFGNTTNQAFSNYYFMNEAIGQNPVDSAAYDQNFSSVGLFSGRAFRPTISMANLTSAQLAANNSIAAISDVQPEFFRELNNGWQLPTVNGRFGTNYLARAYIAYFLLAGLTLDQAIYPTYFKTLSTANSSSFSVFFPDGEPPLNRLGFWSFTLYASDGFLVDNPYNRYNFGTRDSANLQKSANGSFSLIVSYTEPATGNWLPGPLNDTWIPTLRVYQAAESVINGNWTYPIITKIS